jgi:hypothetical protein
MRRVGIEEAAAVGAELLDRDLTGGRPEGNVLGVDPHRVGQRVALRIQHWAAGGIGQRLIDRDGD